MPTYEFECKECGYRFSVHVPWTKKEETVCLKCSSRELREIYGVLFTKSGSSCNTYG